MPKVVNSEVRYAQQHMRIMIGLWRYCWKLERMSTSVSENAPPTVGLIGTQSKQLRSDILERGSCSYFLMLAQ